MAESRQPPPPRCQSVTEGLNRELQLQGHSHSGLLSPPKSAFSSCSALFLTVSSFCQLLFLACLFFWTFPSPHSFTLPICLNADLCASPSSPSFRFRSVAWSWPTLCPFWPSGAAVHLLLTSPPPVRPLALNTDGEWVLTLEKQTAYWTPFYSHSKCDGSYNKSEFWL